MIETTYAIRLDNGGTFQTTDAEQAEWHARRGYSVTASTRRF